MSAIPPLSGGKPTSGKPAATAAFDPTPTFTSHKTQAGHLARELNKGFSHSLSPKLASALDAAAQRMDVMRANRLAGPQIRLIRLL
jgi:hypothetical protein